MTTLSFTRRLALIGLIAVCNISFCARVVSQAASPQSDSITVNLRMEKELVAIGQSPVAILTVKNLSKHEAVIHGTMYRVHAEGETGEPPTTQVQRQITGRLRPGEAALRGDEYVVWEIEPGKSGFRKFLLS